MRRGFKAWLRQLVRQLERGPINRDELILLLHDVRDRGLVDQEAMETMERVLQVSELRVSDVMLTRSQMVVIEREWAPEEMLPRVVESGHSRFPVIDGDRDKVVGILLAKDLLRFFSDKDKNHFRLKDHLRPAIFIPESKRLNILLKEFRDSRNHMAVVVNEYGGVAGLVTIEDVLEQIVGDIADEHDIDEEAAMIMNRESGEYVIKALYPLEDFDAHFNTHFETDKIDTVGGLVVSALGHVPKREESVQIGEYLFEGLNADSRRVHLLRVTHNSNANLEH